MLEHRIIRCAGASALLAIVLFPFAVVADEQAGIDFFERRIRPLLAEHC